MPDLNPPTDLTEATALELWQLIRDRHVSVTEAVQHFLDRIEDHDTFGAFVATTPELALQRAAELDAASDRTPVLFGLPSADKDLHLRAGTPTTFGSRAFAGYVPDETDALTRQLDAAGMVSLGKTASPEFGFAGYTSSLAHGHTTIPGHPDLGAGGSSGGAAAAVAGGLLPFAPGSDAGGSVRIPAAACGIVGLKPTRGRIPALGGQGSIGQLAVAGALGRTVADVALMVDGMIHDRDGAGLLAPAVRGELSNDRKRARIAVLTGDSPWQEFVDTPLAPEARAAADRAAEKLARAGHEIDEVAMPHLADYAERFVTLWHFNAAALPVNDEQFDLLEPMTQEFIRSGRTIGPRRVVEAVQAFATYEQQVVAAFAPFDAVITPTTALTPRPVGWHTDDPDENFKRQCQYTPHTSFVNVVGLPALSIPVLSLADGLSMSVQLIGRANDEANILALGRQLER